MKKITKKITVGGGTPEPSGKIYRAIIEQYGSGIFGSPKKRIIEIEINA